MQRSLIACVTFASLTHLSSSAIAAEWYPSKYGAEDTFGAINNLSAEKVIQAAKLVTTGKTYALGVETGRDSPAYPPRTYSMTVLQLDDCTGTPLGSNQATGNDDLMTVWMGIGSQNHDFQRTRGNRCSRQEKKPPCAPCVARGWCANTTVWRSPAVARALRTPATISSGVLQAH